MGRHQHPLAASLQGPQNVQKGQGSRLDLCNGFCPVYGLVVSRVPEKAEDSGPDRLIV